MMCFLQLAYSEPGSAWCWSRRVLSGLQSPLVEECALVISVAARDMPPCGCERGLAGELLSREIFDGLTSDWLHANMVEG